MSKRLKILLAASEGQPFSKTGGLADVMGALPIALYEKGHDVRTILPKYQCVTDCKKKIDPLDIEFNIPIGVKTHTVRLSKSTLAEKVPVYLVENDFFFNRDGIYGTQGTDYPDNADRFIFFCRAILESCKALSFYPDIIHLNDWHTGLVPVYLKLEYAQDENFKSIRTIFSIHNLAYQGNYDAETMNLTGLPDSLFSQDGLEFYNQFSFMKGGLVYADLLTTMSPTYSKEIMTSELGCGMEGLLKLREQDLTGILNGVDYEEWNPETDSKVITNYSSKNIKGKLKCKRDLMKTFSLTVPESTPIIGMVTRLSEQKGIDLIMEALDEIINFGAAFVLLGTGNPDYEKFFQSAQQKYPGKCGVRFEFDETLSHKVIAGSDIFMVPSRYEPCGLTQMYALRYGTIPLVRAVGGLHDTVTEYQPNSGKGSGFKFNGYEKEALIETVRKALTLYQTKSAWKKLIKNAFAEDFSWPVTADKYLQIYRKVI